MVKTRLAQSLPSEAVTEFYRCLLDDTVALARSLGNVEVAIMCPASDVDELACLAARWMRVVAQKGEGLAAGLTSVFAHFAALASGASSPSTATAHICRRRFLESHSRPRSRTTWLSDRRMTEATISSAPRPPIPRFSTAMGWALRVRLRRCWRALATLQLSVGFTDPFYDIDVANDLTRLAAELRLAPAQGATNGGLAETSGTRRWRSCGRTRETCEAHAIPQAVCSRRRHACGADDLLTQASAAWVDRPSSFRWQLPASRTSSPFVSSSPRRDSRGASSSSGSVLAALWHFAFLLMPPGPDDDIHRYVWDGRVQRLGYNPYIVVPSDPALAGLHTPETRTLNNPDLPSPYPAGARAFLPRRNRDS